MALDSRQAFWGKCAWVLRRVLHAGAMGGALAAAALLPQHAVAGGPRFVTGTTYSGTQSGVPMAFRISNPLYYTDPGDLSAAVSHAQAEAMVAAAAAPWNIPTASLMLAQGGTLAEHVSSGNIVVSSGGITFPADVDPGNYLSKPIAVIYDTNGSVTDLLLGAGASDPLGCRQNGVTESVDRFGQGGTIDHALIIINGRCVPSAGAPLLQVQYQLERAFGRVLGLAWSQLNDNVFTGASTVTAQQVANWPLMHPLDVLCGPYTYQCITSPFALRTDDRNALSSLYPVTTANLGVFPGKVVSTANSVSVKAFLQFPTGQGMDMVNVTVRRMPIGTREVEPFEAVSGVSGVQYQQVFANIVRGAVRDSDNIGTAWQPAQALVAMPYIEVGSGATLYMTSEPINPLYTGEYTVGPYTRPPVTPSGSAQSFENDSATPGSGQIYTITFGDAAASCSPGADGTESNPVPGDASGWWDGLLCSVGHTSWWSAGVKAGRSWTVEVQALDEQGALTLNKAQPVLGVWKSTDATGTAPTLALTPASMNTMRAGVTQIRMPVTASDTSFRLAVADQFGGGRPDFLYRTRIFAVDAITPSVLAASGGQITLSGRGFATGVQVQVNGVAATVLSSTATQIIARIPTAMAAHGLSGAALPVTVVDPATGASSSVVDAMRYSIVGLNALVQVSAPASLKTGVTSATPFAVKVLGPDGVTPLAGATVRFTVTSGTASLAACGSAPNCTVTTNGAGLAQTTVTGVASGVVEVSATELSSNANLNVDVTDTDPVRSATIAQSNSSVTAGTTAVWNLTLTAFQDGLATAGAPVVWSAAGLDVQGTSSTTVAGGQATATVHTAGLVAGVTATVTGCVWVTTCASWQVTAVAPVRSVSLSQASSFVFAQTAANWSLSLQAIQDGAAFAGAPVAWTSTGGLTVQAATTTNGGGVAVATVSTSGLSVGTVATVTACAWTSVCASWGVTAVDAGRVAVIANAPAYVASGAGASWNLTLTAVQQGAAIAGTPVVWSSTGGLLLGGTQGVTGASGQATMTIATAGLAPGTASAVTACAWTTTCTTWQVTVVDPAQWHVTVTSGAGQSATVASTLAPIMLAVLDDAGHAVEGAPVTLYQTVAAWEGACPAQGRCASAPVLAYSKDSFSTDGSGLLAITPLRVPGVPQVVNLAAVAGTAGFLSVSIPVTP